MKNSLPYKIITKERGAFWFFSIFLTVCIWLMVRNRDPFPLEMCVLCTVFSIWAGFSLAHHEYEKNVGPTLHWKERAELKKVNRSSFIILAVSLIVVDWLFRIFK